MLKTRSRIINFRVTEDEFTRLRTASVENGARCLSDYARTALMHALEGCSDQPEGRAAGKGELQALGRRLGIVELTVAKLESLLSTASSVETQRIRIGAPA